MLSRSLLAFALSWATALAQDPEELRLQALEAARSGLHVEAVQLLVKAVEAGLENPMGLVAEPAFQPLRQDPRLRDSLAQNARSWRASIVAPSEPGPALLIQGRIVDQSGKPVAGARVYLYHTDRDGVYSKPRDDSRNPRYYAYLETNSEGRFELATIRPAGYPGGGVPQHVHYEIQAEGFRKRVAEFLFDDDERLTPSARTGADRRGWPIVKVTEDGSGRQRCEVEVLLERQ